MTSCDGDQFSFGGTISWDTLLLAQIIACGLEDWYANLWPKLHLVLVGFMINSCMNVDVQYYEVIDCIQGHTNHI